MHILRPKGEAPIIVLTKSERLQIDKLNEEDPISFLDKTVFPKNAKVARWKTKTELHSSSDA